jgi:hypothetical protein
MVFRVLIVFDKVRDHAHRLSTTGDHLNYMYCVLYTDREQMYRILIKIKLSLEYCTF